VPQEERIPHIAAVLASQKDGMTINEIFVALTRNKKTATLFPTRRSVKRVLSAQEDELFVRSTPTIWTTTKPAKTQQKPKNAKSREKGKKGASPKKR
jgi:hypothetical protein